MSRAKQIPDALDHLRSWREQSGMSRQQVVTRMIELRPERGFIDQATLAKWEAGQSALSVGNLFLLAAAIKVKPEHLFYSPRTVARLTALEQPPPRRRKRRALALGQKALTGISAAR